MRLFNRSIDFTFTPTHPCNLPLWLAFAWLVGALSLTTAHRMMCTFPSETVEREAGKIPNDDEARIAAAKAERARIKKLKKEEGRRRAIEIAKQRRGQQNEMSKLGTDHAEDHSVEPKSRSGRHGARNQHRHKSFAKWLLDTFPFLSSPQEESISICDVAGGKGELAARLSICHNLRVVLVDPRKADVESCFQAHVLPKLPNKWQRRIEEQLAKDPQFIQKKLEQRFTQMVMNFDDNTLESNAELHAAVQSASLIIGLHADGATEAIVDAALKYRKPFVVVPCCVFPRLFHQRYLVKDDGTRVQVRSHEQFCQYLLQKDSRFKSEILPFEGRNVGIYYNPT